MLSGPFAQHLPIPPGPHMLAPPTPANGLSARAESFVPTTTQEPSPSVRQPSTVTLRNIDFVPPSLVRHNVEMGQNLSFSSHNSGQTEMGLNVAMSHNDSAQVEHGLAPTVPHDTLANPEPGQNLMVPPEPSAHEGSGLAIDAHQNTSVNPEVTRDLAFLQNTSAQDLPPLAFSQQNSSLRPQIPFPSLQFEQPQNVKSLVLNLQTVSPSNYNFYHGNQHGNANRLFIEWNP